MGAKVLDNPDSEKITELSDVKIMCACVCICD